MLPLFTICDRWDVGGVSTMLQSDTGLPTIVIYDGYPGGAGIADLGYEAADRHLHATLDALQSLWLPRRLPVLCPVPQVRQLQRAPRQGGRHPPPRGHPRRGLTPGHSTRIVASATRVRSPTSGPIRGTRVGDR